jgi:hypothetical protein
VLCWALWCFAQYSYCSRVLDCLQAAHSQAAKHDLDMIRGIQPYTGGVHAVFWALGALITSWDHTTVASSGPVGCQHQPHRQQQCASVAEKCLFEGCAVHCALDRALICL